MQGVNIDQIREDALKAWDKIRQQQEDECLPEVEKVLSDDYVNRIRQTGDTSSIIIWNKPSVAFCRALFKYCEQQGYKVGLVEEGPGGFARFSITKM